MKDPDDQMAWIRPLGETDGELLVELGGELDISTAPALQEQLETALAAGPRKVIFELRDVTFIDSSGLAVLLSARRRVEQVELRYAAPSIRRVIELAGLGGTLKIVS
jgi:anti-sigma B factor antagonist